MNPDIREESEPVLAELLDPQAVSVSNAGEIFRNQPNATAHPVNREGRIAAIDVLRGFALLGILLLNIQCFAMPSIAYLNPTAYGDLEKANYWVWWCTHVLGDQKFMSIFSMLFGAGVVLMTRSGQARTGHSAAIHYRRMFWLILFGFLHAHLLWDGDILFSYGICGLLLWPLRNLSAKVLIPVGLVLIAFGSLPILALGLSMPLWPEDALAELNHEWQPSDESIQQILDAFRGSWLDQAPYRSMEAIVFQTVILAFWTFWRAGGLMIVGMGLFQLDFFHARWPSSRYLLLVMLTLPIGVSLSAYGVHWNEQRDWATQTSYLLGSLWNYWGSLLTAIAFASLVILICKSRLIRLLFPLASVGQMALSNYLMQTVICTSIFYGHGLGWFGYLERAEQLLIVIGVWLTQLIVSPIWLNYFRFGPAEWLWRSLTYWKPQPMLSNG